MNVKKLLLIGGSGFVLGIAMSVLGITPHEKVWWFLAAGNGLFWGIVL